MKQVNLRALTFRPPMNDLIKKWGGGDGRGCVGGEGETSHTILRGKLRTLLLQQRVLPLQVVYVLLVCVIFSSHVLDILCCLV